MPSMRDPAAESLKTMGTSHAQSAIIYCRVSSKKQVSDGNGLASQEAACREYAEAKGYTVKAVICDDLTGKSDQRGGLKAMIAALQQSKDTTIVIIDDLNRLARSVRTHLTIRDAIAAAGGKLESPKRVFADDPEDDILEVIEAAFAGEHRRKNAEQTRARMRARCLNGYWCLQLPHGYKYYKVKGQGALVERDEPVASIVQNALESFACGHLQTQADVARFLQSQPDFPKRSTGRVPDQMANNILTNPLYAGYVEVPNWDVSLRPGHHPALIDFETFQTIQKRLNGPTKGIVRKDNSADFPLRGFVECGDCGKPLTSCWAKGKKQRHAYYHCFNRDCSMYGKSIRRDQIEGDFADLLRQMRPSQNLFVLSHKIMRSLWQRRVDAADERKASLRAQLRDSQKEIDRLVERTLDTDSETLLRAYEKRIQETERKRAELEAALAKCGKPTADFDSAFRTAMTFLANPHKLWDSERLEHKRMVLQLAFSRRPQYVRKSGFRTPSTAQPFALLSQMDGGGEKLARPAGFEPAASGLEVPCSIQLS